MYDENVIAHDVTGNTRYSDIMRTSSVKRAILVVVVSITAYSCICCPMLMLFFTDLYSVFSNQLD